MYGVLKVYQDHLFELLKGLNMDLFSDHDDLVAHFKKVLCGIVGYCSYTHAILDEVMKDRI